MTGTSYYDCSNQHDSLDALFKRTIAFENGLPYLRVPSSFPFLSDLVFDFDTRTDLNLVDNIAGELGAIQDFTVASFDGLNDFIQTPVINYGGTQQVMISFWFRQRTAIVASRMILESSANFNNGGGRFAAVFGGALGGAIRVSYNMGGGNIVSNDTVGTYDDNAWHFAEIQIDVTAVAALDVIQITIDGVLNNVNFVDGGGRNTALSNQILYIGSRGGASLFDDIDMHSLYLYDGADYIQFADLYSGIDISGNALHATVNGVTKAYHTEQDYLFTDGFTQYWDNATGLVSLQLPYDVNGVAIGGAAFVHDGNNYTRSELHPTNAFHNLAECFIDFNPTNSAGAKFNIFNRSLGAVFNATARVALPAGFYNAAEPWTFHISELSQFALAGYYVIGERRKTYTQGTDQSIRQNARFNLDRIFVYATDKTNNNDISVLTFTNDIVQVVTDAGGNYIFDANGYAVLINT